MAYATDYTTLLTGSYWSGAEVTGQPVFITYSFDATAPASDSGRLAASAYATFTPFTAAQQAETQQALTEWSSASKVAGGGSGVVFLQVAPGKGDINFAAYNFSSDPNAKFSGGEGFYPWGNWNYSTGQPGTIHFAADQAGAGNVLMNADPNFLSNGLFSYQTVLHEIGHALGLKHPQDAWTNWVDGQGVVHNQWNPNVTYNGTFSIMTPVVTTLTDPTSADWQAIQSIYGTPAQAAQQDSSWSWNSTTYTLTQWLKGGAQTVRGVSTSNVIHAGSGADTIYAIGAGTNWVYGGAGTDVLVGGSGLSYLYSGKGADTFNGWFGPTVATYHYATAAVTVDLLDTSKNAGKAALDTFIHINRVYGSNFADTLIADNGGDTLEAGRGNATLIGGSGRDWIYGGAGNCVITGGGGADVLTGGTGAATFVYLAITDSTPKAPDVITDFHSGDKIDLSAISALHQLSTTPGNGDVVLTYDSVHNRTSVNMYDNASGVADGLIWLTGNHANLTAADFVFATGGGAAASAVVHRLSALMASFGVPAGGETVIGRNFPRLDPPWLAGPRSFERA
jgi:Ca2+-binding RTX toxin-like protein